MFVRQSARHFLLLPFALALLGAAFSLWNALYPTNLFCVTSGCTLFTSLTFKGISLWWAGLSAFALLGFIAALGYSQSGMGIAACILSLDCLLLVVMLLTAPCASCLVAATLFACIYWAFRLSAIKTRPGKQRDFSFLLLGWLVLFVANIGVVANTSVSVWTLVPASPKEQSLGNVYFSPSCPACRQLVQQMNPQDARRMNWFPVAEQEEDIAAIYAMQHAIEQGASIRQAFNSAYEAPALGILEHFRPSLLLLQLRLYSNKAHVLRSGGVLPLVEIQGTPSILLGKNQETPNPVYEASPNNAPTPDLPLKLDIVNRCTDEEPCPDPLSPKTP